MCIMAIFAIANLTEKSNYKNSIKITQFTSIICGDIIFWRFRFYLETAKKTAILRVILPIFIEKKYRSTWDYYVNNHETPTLSIPQKLIYMRTILECKNNKIVPSVLKLQDSDLIPEVQKYP